MFPPLDSDWIIYFQNALPNNESPCWVDIVGSAQYPAAYYYLSPTLTEVAFRMRLNGDPININPTQYTLKEFVWGVEIRDALNNIMFTVRVNASGGIYKLQLLNSVPAVLYEAPISLHSPSLPADNVRVADAGAHFPCLNPVVPDEDYFLDFTLPTSYFTDFDFTLSTYRFCYFTSTQQDTINKEYVCGPIINPPADEPVLCVTKQIMAGPTTVCADENRTWLLLITIYNCGNVTVEDVVLTDYLSTDIVLAATPIFIPNADVIYVPAERKATWYVGDITEGMAVSLVVGLTGSFAAPGHYLLDSGTVDATNLDTIDFGDQGILVDGRTQLTAEKEIVSGPLAVEACRISSWALRITVANTGATDLPNVVVTDVLSAAFVVESGPQLTPSAGYAVYAAGEIVWTIDNLAANSTETLDIVLTGFFTDTGHQIIDTGSVPGPCGQEIVFADTGVDVLPAALSPDIPVSGDITDCVTGRPLAGVSVSVYDNLCRKTASYAFDRRYALTFGPGIYNVLFEKRGYGRKFLTLILQSDMDISADIALAPISAHLQAPGIGPEKIDLFSGILCEKIDAEIVWSSFLCINSRAAAETVDDVIDGYRCSLVCGSKLRLALNLEKNLVYKLDGSKHLSYDAKSFSLCYPLETGGRCSDKKCYAQMRDVASCKEENRVFNIARIKFIAFLYDKNDILTRGEPEDGHR